MKKVFVVFTEKGREKGRISGAILKLGKDGFQHCADFDFSEGSNKGNKAEAVSKLVEVGELPKEILDVSGYPEYSLIREIADIVIIEGRGLNYYSTL